MKIVLKDTKAIEKQEQLTEELIKKYKAYLNAVDDQVFKMRGVRLIRPQLAYIALSLERTLFTNRDKPRDELLTLLTVAGAKAVCEMLCIEMPDEVEIDDKTLKVVR